MSNAPSRHFQPGSSTHDSGPRAGDIGYPSCSQAVLSKSLFTYGPSLKGIELLSRTIMTVEIIFRNSKLEIFARLPLAFILNLSSRYKKVRKFPDPFPIFAKTG
jgi:hypothetical protein